METIIDYRGKTPPKSKAGIPLISAANVKAGRVRFDDPEFISLVEYKTWARRGFTQPGDVLITTEAPAGEVAPYPRRGTYQISRRVMALRPDPTRLDSDFLLYALLWREVNQRLLSFSRGTTVPRVLKTDVTSLSIPCPPLAEQKAIASILGALDAKIELNRRMNATLEATARAIFKSWFVDFDPVRAKMDGRQPAGMSAEVAGLFPDGFEHVGDELVPSGWKLATVKSEFRLTMGQSPPGSTYNEDGVGLPFFQGRRDFGFRFPARRVYCSAPTRFAETGDTLVSVRAPVGDLNMALERCCVGRGVAAVRHRTGAASYTYYAMQELAEDFARYEAEGTVFGSINKKNFESLEVLAPSAPIVAAFEELAEPLDKSIETCHRQAGSLAQIRDTLLPKLLSGELRVGDAERAVEEVA